MTLNEITEGFDSLNPVYGSMSKEEIARFRAGKPMTPVRSKPSTGPSPEIKAKLKSLRDEFANRSNKK